MTRLPRLHAYKHDGKSLPRGAFARDVKPEDVGASRADAIRHGRLECARFVRQQGRRRRFDQPRKARGGRVAWKELHGNVRVGKHSNGAIVAGDANGLLAGRAQIGRRVRFIGRQRAGAGDDCEDKECQDKSRLDHGCDAHHMEPG